MVATKPPRRTMGKFFRKFFLDGQCLEEEKEKEFLDEPTWWEKFHDKHRKYMALAIPFVFIQTIWLTSAIKYNFFSLYPIRWELPITMIFGASIAGMTSEGGGAVAFPVMTFVLHIVPNTARDFTLMMQSIGMSAALFVIVYMGIVVERRAILFCFLGSIPGIIVGLTWLDHLLDDALKKTFFVSVWASFAVALYLLNSERKRTTYRVIPMFSTWKALVLLLTGFVGGIFTAFAGSGIDICTFSVITLLFRVSEKTATPTTIVLMALNSMMGFYWRAVIQGGIPQIAWEYVAVCTPVCVTFAPLGSFLGSHFHRLVLASLIYILEILSVIGFLATRPSISFIVIGVIIIGIGFLFFITLCQAGKTLMKRVEISKQKNEKPETIVYSFQSSKQEINTKV
ncbi:unnamed protein product, partial [Mesorhabditis belari]|uniref:Membrane transporter protein n=1 Tax=Mesorhabditis belari TaxID=2138241 RepID=A0AAF3EB94_9BILA